MWVNHKLAITLKNNKSKNIPHSDVLIITNVSLLLLLCVPLCYLSAEQWQWVSGVLFTVLFIAYNYFLGYLRYAKTVSIISIVCGFAIILSGGSFYLFLLFLVWVFYTEYQEKQQYPIPTIANIKSLSAQQLPTIKIESPNFNAQVVMLYAMYIPFYSAGVAFIMEWLQPIWGEATEETTLHYLIFAIVFLGFCFFCILALSFDEKKRKERQKIDDVSTNAIILTKDKLALVEKQSATVINWSDINEIRLTKFNTKYAKDHKLHFTYYENNKVRKHKYLISNFPQNSNKIANLVKTYWQKAKSNP